MMSTCDALMVSASALFAQNLYKPLVRGKSARHYLFIVRLASVLIVSGGIIIAYLLPGFITGLEIYLRISSIIGLPLLLGFVWRRATVAGAWASVLGCYGVWMLCAVPEIASFLAGFPALAEAGVVRQSAPAGWTIHLPWQILFYLGGGFIAGIAVSLATRPVSADKLDLFFALLRTPIRQGEVLREACTLPEGVAVPEPRYLFPGTGIELLVPGRRTIIGFLAGCAAVALLIGAVVLIMGG
jgi:Na+/proline symporter